MKILAIKHLEHALRIGKTAVYCNVPIVEVKKKKIRLEGDTLFFKPWFPAIKITN